MSAYDPPRGISSSCVPCSIRRPCSSTKIRSAIRAVRPTAKDGVYTVHFCHQQVGHISLHRPEKRVTYVSEHL